MKNDNNDSVERKYIRLELGHLWNMTDRYKLTTSIDYIEKKEFVVDRKTRTVDFTSIFRIYIEDKISLTTTIATQYKWSELWDFEATDLKWGYKLGLEYHLDRLF